MPTLFSGLNRLQIDRILKAGTIKTVKANQPILLQEEKAEHVYLLVDGTVEVKYTTKIGHVKTIVKHQAPYFLGNLEVHVAQPYMATVTMVSAGQILQLTKPRYIDLLHSNHQLCVNYIDVLIRHIAKIGAELRLSFFGSADQLVARYLLDHVNTQGKLVKLNKSDLAKELGLARRSVIRAIHQLMGEGLIQEHRGSVQILNMAGMDKKAKEL